MPSTTHCCPLPTAAMQLLQLCKLCGTIYLSCEQTLAVDC